MDSPEQPAEQPTEQPTPRNTTRTLSAEAIIGTGVTIASLGVLFLLLGWAQAMRHVHPASWVLLAIGAVFVVVGVILALLAPKREKRVD